MDRMLSYIFLGLMVLWSLYGMFARVRGGRRGADGGAVSGDGGGHHHGFGGGHGGHGDGGGGHGGH